MVCDVKDTIQELNTISIMQKTMELELSIVEERAKKLKEQIKKLETKYDELIERLCK